MEEERKVFGTFRSASSSGLSGSYPSSESFVSESKFPDFLKFSFRFLGLPFRLGAEQEENKTEGKLQTFIDLVKQNKLYFHL